MRNPSILGLGVALVLAGCGGEDPAPVTAEQPGLEAVLAESSEMRDPVLMEVPSNFDSLTAKALESIGVLHPVERGDAIWDLTDLGRSKLKGEKEFQTGIPVYYFSVGTKEIVEVVDLGELPGHRGIRRTEFTYRVVPTAIGRELLAAGIHIAELGPGRTYSRDALLILHEDGWRVARIGTRGS